MSAAVFFFLLLGSRLIHNLSLYGDKVVNDKKLVSEKVQP